MALITKGAIITLFMGIRYYLNKDMLLYRPLPLLIFTTDRKTHKRRDMFSRQNKLIFKLKHITYNIDILAQSEYTEER